MSVFTALKRAREKQNEFSEINFKQASKLCIQTTADGSPHDYGEAQIIDAIVPSRLVNFDDAETLRETLSILIQKLDYSWVYLFPSGREAVRNSLSRNELQVFRNAELFADSPPLEVVKWWDDIADQYRLRANGELFRTAEQKSLVLEEHFLSERNCPYKPKWVALNDNSLGFDILSYREIDGEWLPFAIEVKSTVTNEIRFFLTRNEAKLASNMRDSYALHFWFKDSDAPIFFNYEQISRNLPVDQVDGKWQSVLVELTS